MMELSKPPRRGASRVDRFAGPISIVLLSLSLALASQLGVYFATGYSRVGSPGKLVTTQKTAQLLWLFAIMQLGALALALTLLALTNQLDPGNVELNQLPGMIANSEEGAEQRKKTGRMVKTMPDGSEIEFRWCWHCSIWRPPMANHCPTCNRCFLKLDHHCPWTGARALLSRAPRAHRHLCTFHCKATPPVTAACLSRLPPRVTCLLMPGNCIAAHNIRFFWAMIACFGLAGLLIPVGLVTFFVSAFINGDHVHAAVVVIGVLFAAFFVCSFGSMWIGATVMLARTAKTILNPRGAQSSRSDHGQAEWFEEMLARERAQQDWSVLAAPCRCRQH